MLTYRTLCFVFICNNRTVPKFRLSVILSEGLLQAEAMAHFCYDYVHLDNFSGISVYRNHNVQQCKMQIP